MAAGYDEDLVRGRGAVAGTPGMAAPDARVPGWQSVGYDPATRVVSVRRGTLLDLGASAKAHAADLIAARLADELPGGGSSSTSGVTSPSPVSFRRRGGTSASRTSTARWRRWWSAPARPSPPPRPACETWIRDGERRHHIVDPAHGPIRRPGLDAGQLCWCDRRRGQRREHGRSRPRPGRPRMARGTRHTCSARTPNWANGHDDRMALSAGEGRMNEILRLVSRATGVASAAMLTVVLVLGLLTASRRPPPGDALRRRHGPAPVSRPRRLRLPRRARRDGRRRVLRQY